ncbi:MAG: response regulator [Chromatiaceae bacterium]|nr:MAG: response regulator [Chromatiaceae bacterium]
MALENPAAHSVESIHRGTALIVDDEATNRCLLEVLLERQGFRTLSAESGMQALELFAAESADIVFMDVMMPDMNGYETTRRLKAMAGDRFVPVIFLTALTDSESLARCIEAGGDDFLSKPFDFVILNARVRAMERIRDLYRRLAGQQRMLVEARERDQVEQELAEHIFQRVVAARNVAMDRIAVLQRAATTFCGDLVLTAYLPDGGLRVLVGDFTGHGLAAAIGALPVTEIFHTMTWEGADELELLREINGRLHDLLPADRFMTACLATLSLRHDILRFWNGGMPSALLCGPRGVRALRSRALPLGVLPDLPRDEAVEQIGIRRDERLLILSDGLIEAEDGSGGMLGEEPVVGVLRELGCAGALLPGLTQLLDSHCEGIPQRDDITVVEFPMNANTDASPVRRDPVWPAEGEWRWVMEWSDRHLPDSPCVLDAMRPLGLLEGLETHQNALEEIVNELYANALEHGVLELPSSMKSTPEGFESYYAERARRLEKGVRGRICLEVRYEALSSGGRFIVRMGDSGQGFEPERSPQPEEALVRPWGRGISIVRDLCESVHYLGNGSQVEAVYRWRN